MAANDVALSASAISTPETPLAKFTAGLSRILGSTSHSEMWGVEMRADAGHAPTQVILQKYLRANNNDVPLAEKQLTSALEWRKKYQPTNLVKQIYDKKKFSDLGYVTVHQTEDGEQTVITWNIYGAVKDNKATFGNVEE